MAVKKESQKPRRSSGIRLRKLADFKDGWFIGNFEPTLKKTKHFEVAVKQHFKFEDWPEHLQRTATEYNVLIEGKILLTTKTKSVVVEPGDVFVIYPKTPMKPVFLEDCTVVCVKTPSIPDDKVEV